MGRNDKLLQNVDVDTAPFEFSAPMTASFLSLCAGLNPAAPNILVSIRAVMKWIEASIASSDTQRERFNPSSALPNPVLETLISIVSKGDILRNADSLKVEAEGWRECNFTWKLASQRDSSEGR